MIRTNRRKYSKVKRPVQKKCFFCQNNILPNYKEVAVLSQFITERKKIASREYTGTCARHQRRLSRAIKRSRHLALIPFVSQIH